MFEIKNNSFYKKLFTIKTNNFISIPIIIVFGVINEKINSYK